MTEVKFKIYDKVVFFNTSACKFEKGVVKGIQVVPTASSKDENGEDRLEGYAVLYQMTSGVVLTENELFESEAAAKEHYLKVLSEL